MKARISIPGTAGSARLTVLSCAALMVLVSATVSACTGGTPTSSLPAIFSPSGSATGSHSATATTTSTAHSSGTHSPATTTPTPTTTTPTATSTTVSPTTQAPTPTPTTYYPTGAPQTGGGGTAGLQDGLVIGLGGAAVLAGLGSLTYSKRLTRRRR
jgi:hypothetical protein